MKTYVTPERAEAEEKLKVLGKAVHDARVAYKQALAELADYSLPAHKVGVPVLRMSKISGCSRPSHIAWIEAAEAAEESQNTPVGK